MLHEDVPQAHEGLTIVMRRRQRNRHRRGEPLRDGVDRTRAEAALHLGLDITNATIAIQGFGNVGSVSAILLSRLGARIVAVTDVRGGVYNPKGLDMPKLLEYVAQHKTVDDFPGADPLTNDQLFELETDILIPAALENQVRDDNAPRVNGRVRLVAEGANGPTTPGADQVLQEKGVFVIPDFLANAGGVTCSYFEQVQSNMNYFWERDEVLGKLDLKMTSAYHAVSDLARRQKLYMRDVAYVIAIQRVAQACHDRGWV